VPGSGGGAILPSRNQERLADELRRRALWLESVERGLDQQPGQQGCHGPCAQSPESDRVGSAAAGSAGGALRNGRTAQLGIGSLRARNRGRVVCFHRIRPFSITKSGRGEQCRTL